MNPFRLSTLNLTLFSALSFSIITLNLSSNALAADSIKSLPDTSKELYRPSATDTVKELNRPSSSETTRELNRPSAAETIELRDCSSRSSEDKIQCEKEKRTGSSNTMSNDSRNNTLRDDMRARDLNSRNLDNRTLNNRNRDMQSLDNRSRESYPSDTGSSAVQPNGSNSMNSTTGEMRPNAPLPEPSRNNGTYPSRAM